MARVLVQVQVRVRVQVQVLVLVQVRVRVRVRVQVQVLVQVQVRVRVQVQVLVLVLVTIMPVYVDELVTYDTSMMSGRAKQFGCTWCHMWCDPGEENSLHNLAQKIGLKTSYFQDKASIPHYDLTPNKRALALEEGVIPMNMRQWRREHPKKP